MAATARTGVFIDWRLSVRLREARDRAAATRHDKLAANFLAMVQLASMRLWLRAYEALT